MFGVPPIGWLALFVLAIIGAISAGSMPGTNDPPAPQIRQQQHENNNNYGCGNNGIHPDVNGHCP